MPSRTVTFRVLRFDPQEDSIPGPGDSPRTAPPLRYSEYSLDVPQGMTVLEALLRIQTEQDGTLAFRYACRGAVCGSCAMRINGQVDLACRTQVHALGTDTVTIDPLPNLPVLKDLVVDMDVFLEKLKTVQPWLQPARPEPEREHRITPEESEEAEPYTNCILCASCHAVCPAAEQDPEYLGPAALAALYRFLSDARNGADEARLAQVDSEQGVWGCDMVRNCVEVCPKGVPPTKGIGRTRARIRRSQRARTDEN